MAKIKVNGAIFDLTEETISYCKKKFGENFAYELDTADDKSTLFHLTDRYFYAEAKANGGYLNMGEIMFDAQEYEEPDALYLKKLYDAIWAKEEELEAQLEQMTLKQLLELDLETWAKEAFDAVKIALQQEEQDDKGQQEEQDDKGGEQPEEESEAN